MKFKLMAVAALMFSQLALGAESNVIPAKPQPTDSVSGDAGLLEATLKLMLRPIFKGLEKILQDSGLEFDVCSYVSYQTQTTNSAEGMSECLNMNFTQGILNKGDVGITYIWVKNSRQQEPLPIRVDWRPAQEGVLKIANEILTLYFEQISHWWTEKVSKDPAEEKALPYSQNVIGRLRLTFPEGTRLSDFIPSQQKLLEGVEMAKEIEFSATPLYKVDGYANYRGVLTITQEVQEPDENGQWVLDFKTNMNLFKNRKFKVKGNFGNATEKVP